MFSEFSAKSASASKLPIKELCFNLARGFLGWFVEYRLVFERVHRLVE